MIAFRGLALRRGGRVLISNVDLTIHAGTRAGVVGRNGSGKSTLFAALLGDLEADAGVIERPAKGRLASVAQETPALPDSALSFVLAGDAELHAAHGAAAAAEQRGDHAAVAQAHQQIEALHGYDAEARAARLLHGLGFAPDTHRNAVASFSGGWRARLNLARALMAPSDLLLLDEPTNHLDLDAVLWLEGWLQRYAGTLLIISHDREFLDAVCTQVLHIDSGTVRAYSGNYSAFERQRAEQVRQLQAARAREQAEREHLQAFIDRFKAKATKARQAQSRVKRLQKLGDTVILRESSAFQFRFPEPARQPHALLALDDAAVGYAGRPVIAGIRRSVQAGERIGVLGRNGAGKSTLVKAIVGELPLQEGARTAHRDLAIGYFAQHTVESLRVGESPYAHLSAIAESAAPQVLRDWLGNWQFHGDRAMEAVETLSGGERARLALALIAWRRPNLLVLDEPTNHLDLDMREALADALNEYPGAMLLVAHDRHLLGLVCDRFWLVHDGRVEDFDGDLDDYAALQAALARGTAPIASASEDDGLDPRERRRRSAVQREREKPLRDRMKRAEQRLSELDAALKAINAKLSDAAVYSGAGDAATELARQAATLARDHAAAEAEWLAAYEALDGA